MTTNLRLCSKNNKSRIVICLTFHSRTNVLGTFEIPDENLMIKRLTGLVGIDANINKTEKSHLIKKSDFSINNLFTEQNNRNVIKIQVNT